MRRSRSTLACLAALCCGSAVQAQDLAIQGGALRVSKTHESTFEGALVYAHPAGDYAALSISYINEGHPEFHHRDGVAGQVWLRTPVYGNGISYAAGFGLDYLFDTSRPPASSGLAYTNDHGWAPIYSLQMTWHTPSRWYTQVQINRIVPGGSKHPTTAALFGVGYRFDGVRGDKLHLEGPSTDDTLTVLVGQTIVNSFESERSQATSVEYRRAVGHYVDWTVTALNEGSTAATRRNGVATQLWLIRSLDTNVELGMGIGPYATFEVHDVPGRRSHKAGLVSIASRYHFTKRVVGELSWNRVVTDYHRDADLLLAGVGFSF
jgi:hypothetical protein